MRSLLILGQLSFESGLQDGPRRGGRGDKRRLAREVAGCRTAASSSAITLLEVKASNVTIIWPPAVMVEAALVVQRL